MKCWLACLKFYKPHSTLITAGRAPLARLWVPHPARCRPARRRTIKARYRARGVVLDLEEHVVTLTVARLKSRLADIEERLAIQQARRDRFASVEAALKDEAALVRAELAQAMQARFSTQPEKL